MTLLDSLRDSEGEVPPSWPRGRGLRRLSFLRSSGSFFIFMERRRTVPGDLTLLSERPFLGLGGGEGVGSPVPELTHGMGIFPVGGGGKGVSGCWGGNWEAWVGWGCSLESTVGWRKGPMGWVVVGAWGGQFLWDGEGMGKGWGGGDPGDNVLGDGDFGGWGTLPWGGDRDCGVWGTIPVEWGRDGNGGVQGTMSWDMGKERGLGGLGDTPLGWGQALGSLGDNSWGMGTGGSRRHPWGQGL